MLCITLIHAHAVDGQKTPRWLGLMFTINFEGKNNVVSIFSIDVDQIFAQYCLALLLNIAQHCWVLKSAAEHYSAERYWTEHYLFNLN